MLSVWKMCYFAGFFVLDQMKEPLINSDEEEFEHDDDFQKKNEVIFKHKGI